MRRGDKAKKVWIECLNKGRWLDRYRDQILAHEILQGSKDGVKSFVKVTLSTRFGMLPSPTAVLAAFIG